MSATLPLLSLTPVFTTLAAIPMLAELPRPLKAVGILVVVAGALFLNSDPEERDDLGGLWRALLHEKGALLMVVTALLWSLAPPFDKLAMRHATPGMHAFIMVTGIVLGLFAALAAQGRLGELGGLGRRASTVLVASALVSGVAVFFQLLGGLGRRASTVLVASALVSGVAVFFQLLAIQMVWVGLVETVKRGIGAAMALVLGRLVFGEELSRRRMLAVVLMIFGVWMVLA